VVAEAEAHAAAEAPAPAVAPAAAPDSDGFKKRRRRRHTKSEPSRAAKVAASTGPPPRTPTKAALAKAARGRAFVLRTILGRNPDGTPIVTDGSDGRHYCRRRQRETLTGHIVPVHSPHNPPPLALKAAKKVFPLSLKAAKKVFGPRQAALAHFPADMPEAEEYRMQVEAATASKAAAEVEAATEVEAAEAPVAAKTAVGDAFEAAAEAITTAEDDSGSEEEVPAEDMEQLYYSIGTNGYANFVKVNGDSLFKNMRPSASEADNAKANAKRVAIIKKHKEMTPKQLHEFYGAHRDELDKCGYDHDFYTSGPKKKTYKAEDIQKYQGQVHDTINLVAITITYYIKILSASK